MAISGCTSDRHLLFRVCFGGEGYGCRCIKSRTVNATKNQLWDRVFTLILTCSPQMKHQVSYPVLILINANPFTYMAIIAVAIRNQVFDDRRTIANTPSLQRIKGDEGVNDRP